LASASAAAIAAPIVAFGSSGVPAFASSPVGGGATNTAPAISPSIPSPLVS
jgi:hypothetical protein